MKLDPITRLLVITLVVAVRNDLFYIIKFNFRIWPQEEGLFQHIKRSAYNIFIFFFHIIK